MIYRLIRNQKDFVVWAAIWLHLWWGFGGLLVQSKDAPHALRAVYQAGLSVTMWSVIFLVVAGLALVGLLGKRRLPRFWQIALMSPQQFMLMFGMMEIYFTAIRGPLAGWSVFWFLPAAVPLTVFHTARLLLMAIDEER